MVDARAGPGTKSIKSVKQTVASRTAVKSVCKTGNVNTAAVAVASRVCEQISKGSADQAPTDCICANCIYNTGLSTVATTAKDKLKVSNAKKSLTPKKFAGLVKAASKHGSVSNSSSGNSSESSKQKSPFTLLIG